MRLSNFLATVKKNLERSQQTAIEEKSSLLKNVEDADTLKISSIIYHSDRLISLKDISIFYGEKAACKNVSFTIERGDRIALCGQNGSGKSSVIKMICEENIAYQGDFYKSNGLIDSEESV